jgi:hypothetical protein
VTLNLGLFLNAVINFLIIAFAIFLIVRSANRMKKKPEAAPAPTTKECPYCASTIAIKATCCLNCTSELAKGRSVYWRPDRQTLLQAENLREGFPSRHNRVQ